ncbi:hypothetical protein [Faecalimicrobium sp. JNUCC 81]
MFLKKINKKVAMALMIGIVISSLSISANAQEKNNLSVAPSEIVFKNSENIVENEETETVNEYIKLKELSEKTKRELKSLGYNNNDIDSIKQYKDNFKRNIKDLNDLQNEQLKSLGYNNSQIDIIRNFDGSEEQMIKASANCSVSRSKGSFYYDKTNKATNLVVNYSFKWNGVPSFRGTDIMAVSNGEFMYFHNNSYLTVSYSDISNSGASSSRKILASLDGSGNTGASFKFKTLGNNGLSFARSGSGKAYLHKKANITQVGVGVKYGHSTVTFSPGVSFPAGVSIGFSKNVQSIGPNPIICYR